MSNGKVGHKQLVPDRKPERVGYAMKTAIDFGDCCSVTQTNLPHRVIIALHRAEQKKTKHDLHTAQAEGEK